jgi:hypothetical protein
VRQAELLDRGAQPLGVRRGLLALEADEEAGELLAAVARDEVARALGGLRRIPFGFERQGSKIIFVGDSA